MWEKECDVAEEDRNATEYEVTCEDACSSGRLEGLSKTAGMLGIVSATKRFLPIPPSVDQKTHNSLRPDGTQLTPDVAPYTSYLFIIDN